MNHQTAHNQPANTSALRRDVQRYGFQGQEEDQEMWEGAVSYKYRVEDARLGRFFSVDPLYCKYPYYSSYQFSGNRLIDMVELEGLEPAHPGSTNGEIAVAMDCDSGANHCWTWNDCEWIKGDLMDFQVGNAENDSPDGDLNTEYYPNQKINDWQNCKDDLNVGENCHLKNFSGMFSNGIMLESIEAQNEARSLFNHFCAGSSDAVASPMFFSGESEIARILSTDPAFTGLAGSFEAQANAYLQKNSTLNGFDGNMQLASLRKNSQFSYMKDTWFAHTIMGGFCQIDVSIIGVKNGKVELSVTYYDHFGAGRNDADVMTPGLPSMYYLQHNTPSDDNYKPFIWSVQLR
jgi:RHS repeat-associated protein